MQDNLRTGIRYFLCFAAVVMAGNIVKALIVSLCPDPAKVPEGPLVVVLLLLLLLSPLLILLSAFTIGMRLSKVMQIAVPYSWLIPMLGCIVVWYFTWGH
ncbi:MAG: hypothetical protein WCL39_15255 [Armatimonadota bacterium]